MSNFLPEDDQEYLKIKAIKYELLTETDPQGNLRRGLLLPEFFVPDNLRVLNDSNLVLCNACDLLIVIPTGYATTKLDSFYTLSRLKRPDGVDPQNANAETVLFTKTWQFWSRHLDDRLACWR
jgi:hypothetical protein